MTRAPSSDVLSPEDADTAFTGGVHVARTCVGLRPAEFVTELVEATDRRRESLRKAEISPAIAQQTAEAFEIGAATEWRRIYRPEQTRAWGRA